MLYKINLYICRFKFLQSTCLQNKQKWVKHVLATLISEIHKLSHTHANAAFDQTCLIRARFAPHSVRLLLKKCENYIYSM